MATALLKVILDVDVFLKIFKSPLLTAAMSSLPSRSKSATLTFVVAVEIFTAAANEIVPEVEVFCNFA